MSAIHVPRILDAESVDQTTSTVLGASIVGQRVEGVLYTTFSPGCTAGVVKHETAPYEGYTGTWANLDTVTFATANTTHRTNFTGVHGALRSRISTAIEDGTVTVDFLGTTY